MTRPVSSTLEVLLRAGALSLVALVGASGAYFHQAHAAAVAGDAPCPAPMSGTAGACRLHGKVKFVTSFPKYKIQIVSAFPDIKVKKVTSFPDKPGEWQVVDAFPDFTVQVVDAFPDFKVQYVDAFPGCP